MKNNILYVIIILLSFCGDSKELKKELKKCDQKLLLNIIYNSNLLLDPAGNDFGRGAVLAAFLRLNETCKRYAGQ